VSPGVLEGLRVLELGSRVAAPYCAKLLADLGADVVKVEPPGTGDPARRLGPFPGDVPHPERSGLFLYLNTSKRSVTLDLETRAGRELLRRLIARADLLIEDRAAGELERLELDYPRLEAQNPLLVVASVTPFGATGPYRDYRSYALNLYHASGQTWFSYAQEDEEERPAPKAGGYVAEYDAGLTAALGAMAAVLGRATTGRGQHVEVSKQEALMCLERVDIGRFTNDPTPMPFRGSVGGMMRAKDGYFIITPVEKHQWQGLIRAMGNPDWAQADWCQDELGRQQHRDEIRSRIEAWSMGLTRDEIYHRLQAEGTPVGPVRDAAEVEAWEQAQARGFFRELDHPEAGPQLYPTAPHQSHVMRWAGRPAPLLGQHNEEVYRGELGLAPQELARLAAAGVI
jgi:crotonobetainyl-CoA:carnitine CoA-transferase CaiB-like acyl-CoA transferase